MLLSLTISDTVRLIRTGVDPRKSGVLLIGSENGPVVGGLSRFGRCFGRDEWRISSMLCSNDHEKRGHRNSAPVGGGCLYWLSALSKSLVEGNIIGDRFTSDTAINAISMSEY